MYPELREVETYRDVPGRRRARGHPVAGHLAWACRNASCANAAGTSRRSPRAAPSSGTASSRSSRASSRCPPATGPARRDRLPRRRHQRLHRAHPRHQGGHVLPPGARLDQPGAGRRRPPRRPHAERDAPPRRRRRPSWSPSRERGSAMDDDWQRASSGSSPRWSPAAAARVTELHRDHRRLQPDQRPGRGRLGRRHGRRSSSCAATRHAGSGVFVSDRDAEVALLRGLSGAAPVRTPVLRWYDDTGEHLGSKCMVMEAGRDATDLQDVMAAGRRRRRSTDLFVDTFAAVHSHAPVDRCRRRCRAAPRLDRLPGRRAGRLRPDGRPIPSRRRCCATSAGGRGAPAAAGAPGPGPRRLPAVERTHRRRRAATGDRLGVRAHRRPARGPRLLHAEPAAAQRLLGRPGALPGALPRTRPGSTRTRSTRRSSSTS